MALGEKPVIIHKDTAFDAVLDAACDRLMERQAEYSIRRIAEMEARLDSLERELDEFLLQKKQRI
ncbi:MAG: hypothetical protein LBD48_12065 [Treponema sp.]|jgi:hypothetical protein|nr:hypothetical protein [Treponema sp.]